MTYSVTETILSVPPPPPESSRILSTGSWGVRKLEAFFLGRLKYFQGLWVESSLGLMAEPTKTVGSKVSLKAGGKGRGMDMFSS